MGIISSTSLKPRKSKRLDQEQWAKFISEWRSSSESQKAFCTRLNININTFTYMKEKLLKKDTPKRFIPITVREDILPQPVPNIILENSKGIKLYIPTNVIDGKIVHLLKIAG